MTSLAGSARGGFGGFWKSQLSWELDSEREGWLSLARRSQGATNVGGGGGADGKASIERLCLSPYVEKPLNSKVIKSFVPELRSRKCFSCFGILMFYVYIIWTFYVLLAYSYMAMLQKYLKCIMLFDVHSCYYVHFQSNNTGKGMNSLFP